MRAIGILLCLSATVLLAETLLGQDNEPLRDYNSHCPFESVPQTLDQWQSRAADLRLQLRVATGLHPKIDLPPVQPDIYGQVDRDGYSIQRMVFDSLPGLKVTGSLYLPTKTTGRIPAVLCPHGHWDEARFRSAPSAEVDRSLATGAERFESGARNHIQARCVQLARMGCAAFSWDMIGYCDSQQISDARIHGFRSQSKEQEVTSEGWLLYSPKAEGNLQSAMALQTLAVSRAVDAMLSLDFVDPKRIAITGASGGGTQSFIGAAIDDRIAVAFPAVMVSTSMQGGCTCENASLLRIGTNNAELAALIAPRPLGMTAANDWTKDMQTDGYPEMQAIYGLFAATQNVALYPALHFGHNYNHVSRVPMYAWINRHFDLGFEEPILEKDFQWSGPEDLSVWDDQHPKPPSGLGFERSLLVDWKKRVDAKFDRLKQESPEDYQTTLRDGWRVILGLTSKPNVADTFAPPKPADGAETAVSSATDAITTGIVITISYTEPTGDSKSRRVLLAEKNQRLVPNPRVAPCYTYGYNLSQFSRWARTVGTLLQNDIPQDGTATISATGVGAAVAAAAVVCVPELAGRIQLKVDPGEFSFANVDDIRHPHFVPGAERYGDMKGLLSVAKSICDGEK
ncbi:MAG TPA: hypothetical protein DDW52_16130 [Planctomycetaceae bacterium]|nr:hypothetical protein [Planctomycetaceae bacterium]